MPAPETGEQTPGLVAALLREASRPFRFRDGVHRLLGLPRPGVPLLLPPRRRAALALDRQAPVVPRVGAQAALPSADGDRRAAAAAPIAGPAAVPAPITSTPPGVPSAPVGTPAVSAAGAWPRVGGDAAAITPPPQRPGAVTRPRSTSQASAELASAGPPEPGRPPAAATTSDAPATGGRAPAPSTIVAAPDAQAGRDAERATALPGRRASAAAARPASGEPSSGPAVSPEEARVPAIAADRLARPLPTHAGARSALPAAATLAPDVAPAPMLGPRATEAAPAGPARAAAAPFGAAWPAPGAVALRAAPGAPGLPRLQARVAELEREVSTMRQAARSASATPARPETAAPPRTPALPVRRALPAPAAAFWARHHLRPLRYGMGR